MREKSNESAEMYLETILILSEKLPVVPFRRFVANELDFKKSSVSIRHEESPGRRTRSP